MEIDAKNDSSSNELMNELVEGLDLAKKLQSNLSHEQSPTIIGQILAKFERSLQILGNDQMHQTNTQFQPSTVSADSLIVFGENPKNQDLIDHKSVGKRRIPPQVLKRVQVCTSSGIEEQIYDGYAWRKYGQKDILGTKFPRSYYRCQYRHCLGCLATKQVQRREDDPSLFEVLYRGEHTCDQTSAPSLSVSSNSTPKDDPYEFDLMDPKFFYESFDFCDFFHHESGSMQEVSHLSSIITTAIDDPKHVSSSAYGSGREDGSITGIQSEPSLVQEGFLEPFLRPKSCFKLDILALVIIATIKIRARVKEVRKVLQEPMLFCCLFPNNYEIARDTLVQLWMATGLLENAHLEEVVIRQLGRHKGYLTQLEDVGNCCFDLFEKQKFILYSRTDTISGNKKYIIKSETIKSILDERQVTCTAQDLNLNQCTIIDGYAMLDDENATNGAKKLRHVSVVFKHINQTIFERLKKYRELQTLLFIPNYVYSLTQIPSNFFLALRLLQTLDLSGSHIIELPSSIGYLTHLHYLDLSFTLIESLPESIGRLEELQTLKLKDCNHLFDLPKGMKNLTSLRHLDFDVLGKLTSMPRGIGALTELRTLTAFIVENVDGSNIRELKNLNNLTGSLCISGLENVCLEDDVKIANLGKKNHLTRLELRWNPYNLMDQYDSVANIANLTPNILLEELHLIGYPLSQFPGWMGDKLYAKLISISLTKCENTELDICLGNLPHLKHLDILKMDGVTAVGSSFLGETKFPAFPELESLIIDGMASLETWEAGEDYDFPRLSKLIIKNCPKLIELRFNSYMCSLEHLEISRCKVLQSLPGTTLAFSLGATFRSLMTLMINDCPLLKEKYSKDGSDWYKIMKVPNTWIDLKDVREPQGYDSEDESTTGSLSDTDFD